MNFGGMGIGHVAWNEILWILIFGHSEISTVRIWIVKWDSVVFARWQHYSRRMFESSGRFCFCYTDRCFSTKL